MVSPFNYEGTQLRRYFHLLFLALLFITLNTACGSDNDVALHNDSDDPTQSSSSHSSNSIDRMAAEIDLKVAMLSAIDNGDESALWSLFYTEGVDEGRLESIRMSLMAAVFSSPYLSLSVQPTGEEYERFDEQYRYTPNADVVGTAYLDQESNTGVIFYYGEIGGAYRLLLDRRELIEYEGPRNHHFYIDVFAPLASPVPEFKLTVNYTVSGLDRVYHRNVHAQQGESITAQTIESISLQPVVSTDEYSFKVFEDTGGLELIYESEIGYGTEALGYSREKNMGQAHHRK